MAEEAQIEVQKRGSKRFYGYVCGIVSGMTYGTNPLFGLPLLNDYQMSVDTVLFYRYASATICMFLFCLFRKNMHGVRGDQWWLLILLGVFFSLSSIFLFTSYHYIPSGIATTIIYTEPVIVALLMLALKKYPSWQNGWRLPCLLWVSFFFVIRMPRRSIIGRDLFWRFYQHCRMLFIL